MLRLSYLIRNILIKAIETYQRILSPDHGIFKLYYPYGYCRFKPSCSEYAILALKKYGVIKGGWKSIWRALRCNPFSQGGWDPVN